MGVVGFAVEDFERVPCVEDAGVLVSPPQMIFPHGVLFVCKASERTCMHSSCSLLTVGRVMSKFSLAKISKVIFLEVAGRFTSFLAEKLRTIKAVNVDAST